MPHVIKKTALLAATMSEQLQNKTIVTLCDVAGKGKEEFKGNGNHAHRVAADFREVNTAQMEEGNRLDAFILRVTLLLV